MTELHDRLREAREEAGIGSGKMATLLGVHRNTYAAIEQGESELSVRQLAIISEVTDRPLSWFVYGEDGVEPLQEAHSRDIRRINKLLSKIPAPFRSLYYRVSIDVLQFLDTFLQSNRQKR
jgi:transcriptional regulator with XRE-family HTH domain